MNQGDDRQQSIRCAALSLSARSLRSPFQLCYITGSGSLSTLEGPIARAIEAGVDLIQIRVRDVETRALLSLVRSAVKMAAGTVSRVVVNDRLDVALAAGASGVHLGQHSMPARRAREITPGAMLIGVSCHSLDEAREAEAAGADYILLGPVFETPSKIAFGPPLGLASFRNISSQIRTPALALGGITAERARRCIEAGAAGIAAIRMFEEAPSMAELVEHLRAEFDRFET